MKPAYYDRYDYRAFWEGRDYEWQSDKTALESLIGLINNSKDRLIDVGCGFGRNVPSYVQKWKNAVLLDPSDKLLSQAKVENKKHSNLHYVRGFAEKLPFDNSSFDTVLCIRVFHHLLHPEQVIREYYRVLKPGGHLILEIANKRHAKAIITALLTGNVHKILDDSICDRRSNLNKNKGSITFVNHHPEHITKILKDNHLLVERTLSASNLRGLPFLDAIPLHIVIEIEKRLQYFLGKFWFGPRIYFLAKKT